jgi:hypothetical protein
MSRVPALRRLILGLWLLLGVLALASSATSDDRSEAQGIPVGSHQAYKAEEQKVLRKPRPLRTSPAPTESSQLHAHLKAPPIALVDHSAISNSLHDLRYALSTMQVQYFSLWLGKWSSAIDWTSAVLNTLVFSTLCSFSRSIDYGKATTGDGSGIKAQMEEDEINMYFGQTTAAYYGEEAFSIRYQAYDDILWLVLEWLESIKFIELHSITHQTSDDKKRARWHAQQFVPAFSHRARVFYELAEKGWDWHLCSGGLTWNPRLLPYKNTITNSLFVSASISMYLRFPGDENCSPVLSTQDNTACDDNEGSNRGRFNPLYRQAAINGYDWLKNVGLLNSQGLYTDGFHIRDYRTNRSATVCNERNEMVYTYNQGVVLSGLRDLWIATSNRTYLFDGYELVQNIIRATGYRENHKVGVQDVLEANKWHRLGSNGILTELCDPAGTCNQDGQTFKGIFFHHLTAFCEPLPQTPDMPGRTYGASEEEAILNHRNNCASYTTWVVHNAKAALQTRDRHGRFGMWWGASHKSGFAARSLVQPGAVDYRNYPALRSSLDIHPVIDPDDPLYIELPPQYDQQQYRAAPMGDDGDLNDRGRGRTVETQGSGLAVVRAMYEFQQLAKGGAPV